MTPATIRYKNPGAQYPGPSARAFGSYAFEVIGGGHKIAVFDTFEHGAAALFHLLDRVYVGLTIGEAMHKWSGGHHVNSYLNVIEANTVYNRSDYLDRDLIRNPEGAIPLARAMAKHETGRDYPMSLAEWETAHRLFLNVKDGVEPKPPKNTAKPETRPLVWAADKLGEKEIPGDRDNPFIVWCFKEVGRPEFKDDETPWCAAFVGAALKNAGCHYLHGNLLAREYLKYGVELDEPEVGALIIMKRGTSEWQGHVAFISDIHGRTIKYIGGNQSNAVTEDEVDRYATKILGFRRPVSAKKPISEVVKEPSVNYKGVGLIATLSTLIWDTWDSIVDGLASAVDFVAVAIGALPEAAAEVERTTGAAERITSSAGLPWPATAALVIAAVAITFNLANTWKRKRNRGERGDDA